ncbi:MAG: DUF5668 domain-containing protein [Candidatus Bipolaricaulota bacterium]|nr:DUF5668 domain-containing protein [Candidatus Bipolaricaulota bacterium]
MRSRSIVFPLVLIAAGVVLVLNNLGYLPWSVWGLLLRLWPVALIALGLDILLGRSVLRWAIGSALVALVGIAVALAVVGPVPVGPREEVRVPVGGAGRAEVKLSFPVGTLEVRAAEEPEPLVVGELVAPWPDAARWRVERTGELARVEVWMDRGYELPPTVWPNRCRAELALSPRVPLALTATLGEGQARLDLTGLLLTELVLRGGGGPVELVLPAGGAFRASVWGGAGEVTVRVPASVGARIRRVGGCGLVEVVGLYTEQDGFLLTGEGPPAAEIEVGSSSGRVRIVLGP